jgi:hypothetical protein
MRQQSGADLMLAFEMGAIDDHSAQGADRRRRCFRLSTGPDDIRNIGPLDWLGGEQP